MKGGERMKYNIREVFYQDQDEMIYVRKILLSLRQNYPNFEQWLDEKVMTQLGDTRKIIVALSEQVIVGVMVLKNTVSERKICTLWVQEEYRKNGIGTELIKYAIKELETKYPLITVSENSHMNFLPLMEKFHFRLKRRYRGYYQPEIIEYAYNGLLEENVTDECCIIFNPTAICPSDPAW